MKLDLIAKHFGRARILAPVCLTLDQGEVLALTGPSGVGKTTLVRIIAGLDDRFDGTITNAGHVAVVFQEPTLLPWRDLSDNITLTTGCTAQTAAAALSEVGLRGRESFFPGQLSLGQQRRVALARALAAKPQTLILDEAFASLDETTALRMRQLVSEVLSRRGLKTIIVTHNLDEATELADQVVMLNGAPASVVLDHRIDAPRENRDHKAELATLRSSIAGLNET